jgi:hypothetical protein
MKNKLTDFYKVKKNRVKTFNQFLAEAVKSQSEYLEFKIDVNINSELESERYTSDFFDYVKERIKSYFPVKSSGKIEIMGNRIKVNMKASSEFDVTNNDEIAVIIEEIIRGSYDDTSIPSGYIDSFSVDTTYESSMYYSNELK